MKSFIAILFACALALGSAFAVGPKCKECCKEKTCKECCGDNCAECCK